VNPSARSISAIGAVIALASGALLLSSSLPAEAAACTSPVRYASSSNTLYLVATRAFTLSDIMAACPSAPLSLVDPASKTWELSADLVLQNGSTLTLHGGNTGDANTLRIRSLADNAVTHVEAITAQYGTIDIANTHILSWDDATGAPDTDPSLPANAGSTDRGRAFIRALSYLDSDGVTPHESAMYISNSELDHLGYYDSESYGVAYKTRGCDHATGYPVCQAVHVYGSETGSRFHDNFMGTYTWGAYGISFLNNEYDHNFMYGLDPHDVSTYLVIDHNHFDYNGDHGVICSQRCDHLTITNNESDHNGMTPFMGPTGDSDSPGQVHGIMIHRGVTNTVISGNYVHDQPNGAGIAVFDSAGDVITNNTIARAEYGIRLSVGSANNTISANTVTNSSQYGVFMYKGTDLPSYTTTNGHPTGNILDGNTISGTGSNGIKLTEADGNQLRNSTITGTGGSLLFTNSASNVLTNDMFSAQVTVTGSSTEPGSLTVANPVGQFPISVDTNSTADVTSAIGQLFTVGSLPTAVTPTGSSLHLASALVGTGSVTVKPAAVTVVPAGGTATARATGTGAGTTVLLGSAPPGVTIAFSIGSLTNGSTYAITRDGVAIGSATADGSGVVGFGDALPSGGSATYALIAS
jgi:mannuronan 5-epimerase